MYANLGKLWEKCRSEKRAHEIDIRVESFKDIGESMRAYWLVTREVELLA